MKYVVEIKTQDGEMVRVKDLEGNDIIYTSKAKAEAVTKKFAESRMVKLADARKSTD